jgi:ketol-acid reductoisomerase
MNGQVYTRKDGKNSFARFMNQLENNQLEVVGKEMRKMMWKRND